MAARAVASTLDLDYIRLTMRLIAKPDAPSLPLYVDLVRELPALLDFVDELRTAVAPVTAAIQEAIAADERNGVAHPFFNLFIERSAAIACLDACQPLGSRSVAGPDGEGVHHHATGPAAIDGKAP